QECVGRLRPRGGAQLAQSRRCAQQHVEIGLGEIGLPGVDGFDYVRVDVYPNHLDASAGQGRGGRQADIAQTDDAYGLDRVVHRSTRLKSNRLLGPEYRSWRFKGS